MFIISLTHSRGAIFRISIRRADVSYSNFKDHDHALPKMETLFCKWSVNLHKIHHFVLLFIETQSTDLTVIVRAICCIFIRMMIELLKVASVCYKLCWWNRPIIEVLIQKLKSLKFIFQFHMQICSVTQKTNQMFLSVRIPWYFSYWTIQKLMSTWKLSDFISSYFIIKNYFVE